MKQSAEDESESRTANSATNVVETKTVVLSTQILSWLTVRDRVSRWGVSGSKTLKICVHGSLRSRHVNVCVWTRANFDLRTCGSHVYTPINIYTAHHYKKYDVWAPTDTDRTAVTYHEQFMCPRRHPPGRENCWGTIVNLASKKFCWN